MMHRRHEGVFTPGNATTRLDFHVHAAGLAPHGETIERSTVLDLSRSNGLPLMRLERRFVLLSSNGMPARMDRVSFHPQ